MDVEAGFILKNYMDKLLDAMGVHVLTRSLPYGYEDHIAFIALGVSNCGC